MLLVEQGVLCVLPMLWLVLLLSEAGAVVETGCSLEMGPALPPGGGKLERGRIGKGRGGGKKNMKGQKNKPRRQQGRPGMAHPGPDLSSPIRASRPWRRARAPSPAPPAPPWPR